LKDLQSVWPNPRTVPSLDLEVIDVRRKVFCFGSFVFWEVPSQKSIEFGFSMFAVPKGAPSSLLLVEPFHYLVPNQFHCSFVSSPSSSAQVCAAGRTSISLKTQPPICQDLGHDFSEIFFGEFPCQWGPFQPPAHLHQVRRQ